MCVRVDTVYFTISVADCFYSRTSFTYERTTKIMLKTDKIVQIRRQKGKSLRVVREHYVREDIPCQSQLCLANCQQFSGRVKLTCTAMS